MLECYTIFEQLFDQVGFSDTPTTIYHDKLGSVAIVNSV